MLFYGAFINIFMVFYVSAWHHCGQVVQVKANNSSNIEL